MPETVTPYNDLKIPGNKSSLLDVQVDDTPESNTIG